MPIRKVNGRFQADCTHRSIRVKKTFDTREEAREFERELVLRKRGEIATSVLNRIRIDSAITSYSEQFSSGKSPATHYNEKRWLNEFSEFMRKQNLDYVHEIELIHLQRFQKHLSSRGLSGATVNRQFNTFKHFLSQCDNWKSIIRDPCKGLKRLKFVEKKKKLWSDSEVILVKDDLHVQWHKDGFFLCSRTGLRPIEICDLEWIDVDLVKNVIYPYSRKGTGDEKQRSLPIPDDVASYLKEMKQRPNGRRLKRWVLENKFGGQCRRIHLTNAVTESVKKLGLGAVRLYGVKHTLASNLRAKGVDVETIRQTLGHTNLATTQKYLQNLGDDSVIRDALEKVRQKL